MVFYLVVLVVCFIWITTNASKNKVIKSNYEWYKKFLLDENIREEEDKSLALGYSAHNDFLVYTNREYVYCVNQRENKYEKIYKKDILEVDVEVYRSEKNVKRLVALTSTFDKSVIVSDIIFKMTTRDKAYSINCMINGRDNCNRIYTNRSMPVDDTKRVKLTLEDDIKNIKETNI